jgi:MOSC domain-containing protein YiiM
MPSLLGIARRSKPKAIMEPVGQAAISIASGVQGDARGKPGKRQVTVLSADVWAEVCDSLCVDLPWSMRRANLLVDGMRFSEEDVGRRLAIGQVVLEVRCECDPCNRMDLVHPGLRKALEPEWRGGVCCTVIKEGIVQIGDFVRWQ